ncbi:hypothetical protein ACIQ4I_16750 [Rummeliibacillus sp. NPDC094406]|uniref:hypothetical protein n=1 Tax=Rummeliibacillus sp. NPDC094406 TaxID=3364511 RepID=UPI00381AA403
MRSKIDLAVLNNIAWCQIICITHGIVGISKKNIWGLHSKAPTFYPEVITSDKRATIEEVKYFIENGKVSSIKDSYANLNLTPLGFDILFEAEWIVHEPILDFEPIQTNWRIITTEKDLKKWNGASELENVIKSELLKQQNVKIFICETKDGISGFIANLSEGVVGISNVFSIGYEEKKLWRDIPKIISKEFPKLSMVGYEHNSSLIVAKSSGWEAIGPLRVWIKLNK